MPSARRVAITGLGVVAPPGESVPAMFDSVAHGRSSIALLAAPWAARLQSPIAATSRFDGASHFPPARLKMLDRVSQLALAAAAQAVDDARLDCSGIDPRRCGVFVGTGVGGAGATDDGYETLYGQQSERVKPYSVLLAMNNAAASWVGMEIGFGGPNFTYSTACSSSSVAIGEAARRIRSGDADVMLAGGAEAPLTLGVMRAWEALKTVASVDRERPETSCRPFARSRSGLVLGEGAAFVVLEELQRARTRGATIHAELAGYGLASDHEHITRPSIAGQAEAMRAALADADLDAGAIGYVNAHGTGTAQNDVVETAAIREVFGAHVRRLVVSSTKAVHGHLLGAAGALELVIAVTALERRLAPPTMHLDAADPACDLDYATEGARPIEALEAVMSNSFAFGGTNAVLVARRVE